MRVVIAAGLALLMAVLMLKTFVLKKTVPATIAIPTPHHVAPKQTGPKHRGATKVHVDPTLPSSLRRALMQHPVVVAILYAGKAPGDDEAVQAARAGAHGAHAGFAVLDVGKEAVAQAVALKALVGTTDPSVLVVRRPGTITVLLNGYSDSDTVATAARNAR